MRGKMVNIIIAISMLSGLLWASGLSWGIYDYFHRPVSRVAQPADSGLPQTENEDLSILALGDSLTRGTGDATGKGYVGYLTDGLKATSKQKVSLYNLGIKGQTSAQLAALLKQKEVQRQVKNAKLILITIGGNDLFRGGQTLVDLDPKQIQELEAKYLQNLAEIFTELSTLNPQANILLLGLYNPFSKLADGDRISKIVRDWNYQTANLCAQYSKTVFVPTFDLFQLQPDAYLYTDNFHPNTEGYKLLAERVAALINR